MTRQKPMSPLEVTVRGLILTGIIVVVVGLALLLDGGG